MIVQGTLTKCDFAKVRRIATLLNAIKKRNNEAKRSRAITIVITKLGELKLYREQYRKKSKNINAQF